MKTKHSGVFRRNLGGTDAQRNWNTVYQEELRKEENRADKDWQSFDPKGNVYLIGNKSLGYFKVGLTRDYEAPDNRFKTIQRGVPFDLDVLRYWFVSHAKSFERLIHYELRDRVIRGEWFKIPSDELDTVVSMIKNLAMKVAEPFNAESIT